MPATVPTKLKANLRVQRFDPESERPETFYQDYEVEVEDWFTVLDALIKIREEIDGTLSLRCACRASICGSCAMRVNGQAKLVCKTKLDSVWSPGETVIIDPPGNMPVITDLVADFKPFWDKIRQVQPYLQPTGPEPVAEYLAPNEDMVHLAGVMNCIMCGACVSDCTVLEVDDRFIGPAALAKAYRFVADPRDGKKKERLEALNGDTGIWDCTRCMQCVEVCPKDVAPMERIMVMRDQAIEEGFSGTVGARHTESVYNSVKRSGRLNETRLAIESVGVMNIPGQLAMAPVGVRALLKGKMPSPIDHKIPSKDAVKKIVEKSEETSK
ncbi:MAG: succinate dehydrogenase iron-sulfur subunit [Chloroflexi bacterium]|nr:succinate dehydrogenase iron-sulfur subunit [Chloroflexota bacterium]